MVYIEGKGQAYYHYHTVTCSTQHMHKQETIGREGDIGGDWVWSE